MKDNEIEVIEKANGKYIIIDIETAIARQQELIFLDTPYRQSLYDIWEQYKKPFIAESSYGTLVLIYKNPIAQRDKYEGNVYGRVSKKGIKDLIQKDIAQDKDSNKQIYFAWEEQWRFIITYPN